jgi:hypothetical protein
MIQTRWESGFICVFYLPLGEATVNVYDPDGNFAGADEIEIKPSGQAGIPFGSISLWLPTILPDGRWRAVATMGGISTEATFEFKNPEFTVLNDIPGRVNHPLERSPSRPNHSPGEQLVLHGINFDPNSRLFLGVYYFPDFSINNDRVVLLVDARTVNMDETGRIITGLTIPNSYKNGSYYIIYSYRDLPESFHIDSLGFYPSFTVVNASQAWQACSNTYPTRLHIGDLAHVGFDPPLANNVRNNPNLQGKLLGQIQPGDGMQILSGPVCAENWVWWFVRSEDANVTGWTAEGDKNGYWLVPEQ